MGKEITAQDILDTARLAHETNRIYSALMGDFTQLPWPIAPDWQVKSAIDGVIFHVENPDAGDSASHESWCNHKYRDGWKHGEEKDPEAKTHPCMVPFEQLPDEQKTKDALFRAVVHARLKYKTINPALIEAIKAKQTIQVPE